MREIEFRAWDKKLKTMYSVLGLEFIEKKVEIGDYDENYDSLNWFEYRSFDEVILLEYTGLKDKNGKKIFEGDIVLRNDGQIERVRWTKQKSIIEDCGFFENDEYHGDYIPRVYYCSGFIINQIRKFYFGWLQLEVIGNDYENPEILRGK